MSFLVDKVLDAAMYWWRGKRPIDWPLRAHIRNPTINCVTKREHRLAKVCGEVAAYKAEEARDRRAAKKYTRKTRP